MKIVFFGTPHFAANILSCLLSHHVDVMAVVTKPDRPKGRSQRPSPPPVKVTAQSWNSNIAVYQPEVASTSEFAETLKEHHADLFVVVAYGEILKQNLLDIPPLGCINVHASLLPKYRGAAPIQWCLINGEKETGVTIMHMVRKLDAGGIIKVGKLPIDEEINAGELQEKLCQLGAGCLLETLQDFEKGSIHSIPQDHSQATYAPKIELEDCEIHWDRPARTLHNLVRGVCPHPGAWCYVEMRGERKRLKILKTRVYNELKGRPGDVLKNDNEKELIVACREGALCLLELQLEGKKQMTGEEFLRGVSLENLLFSLDF